MSEPRQTSARWIVLAAILALAGVVAIARTATPSGKGQPAKAAVAAAASNTEVKRYQVPVTASQPSKGPADAIVTIVEWCDVRGADCVAADQTLDAVLAQYGDKVRLVFRHFTRNETGAEAAHEFTRIAYEHAGKFWEAKALIERAPQTPTRADLEHFAEQLDMDVPATRDDLDKHTFSGHVVADRLFAKMFEVESVPAFFVNGRRLIGETSAPALKALIDDETQRASTLVARGVPKNQVYAELTKNGVWNKLPTRPN